MQTEDYVTLSADGTPIAWYDFGGTGPDLLLGHATGFCGRMWEPVITHLLPYFHCITYDVRGHGISGTPESKIDGFDWDRFTDDVVAVLNDAELENPFGVGHSSGGATELLVEERMPGTFRSLFLFEPVIFAANPPTGPMPDRELALRTRKRRTNFSSRSEAFDNFSKRGPFAALDKKALNAYLDFGFETSSDGSLRLRCNPDNEADVYVMASAHNGYVDLPLVACEVKVAHGEHSKSFSTSEMAAVVDRLPKAELVEFSEVGHFGPLEQPERFAHAVLQAFDRDSSINVTADS